MSQSVSIQQQRFQQPVGDGLVRLAQSGDMSAHSEIYAMFSQAVLTLARGICRNQQCAEDVVSNTFVRLIDRIGSFEFRAPFGMWLRQIAVNESLMYLRRQKKHQTWESTDDLAFFDSNQDSIQSMTLGRSSQTADCSDFADQHSDRNEINNAVAELPEHVRLILWLKEIEGYTHEEIAAVVGKTPSYSKSIVARSYKHLRAKMSTPELIKSERGI